MRVYDAGNLDWLGYLEGLGVATGTGAPAIEPSNYNQASIAVEGVVRPRVVTRTVTAVTAGLYRADISVPGFDAVVSPSILYLSEPGDTAQFTVTLTPTTAEVGTYASGFLEWHGAGTSVRSPIAARPEAVESTADEVRIDPASDSISWEVTSGVNGAFPISAYGLAAGNLESQDVNSTGFVDNYLDVSEGTKLVRFATAVPDPTSPADIDLAVYFISAAGAVSVVGLSGGSTADEEVNLLNPAPGTYVARVTGFADAPATDSTPYTFKSFVVDGTSPNSGSLTVSPTDAVTTAGQASLLQPAPPI